MKTRIPVHKNCKNCGDCCGFIPASPDEVDTIRQYLADHPGIAPGAPGGRCPFRDNKKSRCLIYPVRPAICRLMGVTWRLSCPNGNSRNIDGRKFLKGLTTENMQTLNWVNWNETAHDKHHASDRDS